MDGSPRWGSKGRGGDLDADAVRRRAVATSLVEGAHMIGVAQAAEHETVGEFGALHRLDDHALAVVLGAVHVIAGDVAVGLAPGQSHLAVAELGGKTGAVIAPARPFARHVRARRLDHAFRPEKASDE